MLRSKIDINFDTRDFEIYYRPGFNESGQRLFKKFLEFIRPIGRWNKDRKCWSLPATEENLQILSESGFDLGINNQLVGKLKELNNIRDAWQECSDIEISDFGKKLYPFQKQAVGFLVQHGGRALIADEMGCIAGNMRITIHVKKNIYTLKLRDLYEKRSDIFKLNVYTNSFDEANNRFVLNKINNIIYQGKKPVYAVITKNNYIEATDDHIFFTSEGEKELRQLKISDLIYINDDGKPELEQIIYIMPFGVVDVYDLQMAEPYHNFVANNMVVHNCGKTIETLAYFAVDRSCLPVLFIVPNIVKYNWQKEIIDCLREESIVLTSKNISITDFEKFNYYIINYDIMHKPHVYEILKDVKFNSIVLDEVHYIKSFTAKRSKTIKKLVKEINPRSLIGLTGTPIRNRPSEIFNFLNMLRPDVFNSFTRFAFRYCDLKESPFGGSIYVYKNGKRVAYQVGVGVKNYKELHLKLKDAGMIRRRKVDVLKELPQKVFSTRLVDIDNRNEYNTAERDIAEWIRQTDLILQNEKDQRIRKALRAKYIVKLTYLTRLVAEGKYTSLLDTIYDLLECEYNVVIFGIHTDPLFRLAKDLKAKRVKNVILTGKNNNIEKEEAIRKFQNGDARVFIGSMFAAGIGITLTASSTAIMFEYPWTPDVYQQAVDRLHRIGQENSVNIYNLVGVKTVDDYMIKVLDEKRATATKIVDGIDPNGNNKVIIDAVLDQIRDRYNINNLVKVS